ncbi:MAG: hypothetical protein ABI042_11675 [Verrucomicrobiota bacterium]
MLVGIAGGSCSGKEQIRKALVRVLDRNPYTVDGFTMDNYYVCASARDLPKGEWNFDCLKAFDLDLLEKHLVLVKEGQNVEIPIYSKDPSDRIGDFKYYPSQINLVDGILLLATKTIRNLFDFTVFVDVSEKTLRVRRIIRDSDLEGRTEESIDAHLIATVLPAHRALVLPTKDFAHEKVENNMHWDQALPFEESEAGRSIIHFLKQKIIEAADAFFKGR